MLTRSAGLERTSGVIERIFEISMSLDGYVTASGVRAEEPMDGGQSCTSGHSGLRPAPRHMR
jgi:hypothetical protein